MPDSKIANFYEEVFESIIDRLEEAVLEQKTMPAPPSFLSCVPPVDKELLKMAIDKFVPLLDASIEQNTMTVETGKALANHFFDLYSQQDTLAKQIMELICENNLSQLKK